MTKSGAKLAHEHFYPGAPPTALVEYVQEFAHSGKTIDGKPTTLREVRFGLTPVVATAPAPALRSFTAPLKVGLTANVIDALFLGVADGTWKLWIRVSNESGTPSAFAQPVIVPVDRGVPSAPTGLTVKVTVELKP